jgi:hypothetical protein
MIYSCDIRFIMFVITLDLSPVFIDSSFGY